MKKFFKSITAVALVASMGCTTAFASSLPRLNDSDFVKSYEYDLHYRLTTLYFENMGNRNIYSWEGSKRVYVGVSEGRNITATRLYSESSITVKADKAQHVVLRPSNKPNPTLGWAYYENYVTSIYPAYTVTPYVYDTSSYLPTWYKTKNSYSVKKDTTGVVNVPVPNGSSRFYWKPYSLVFTNAPINFNATIIKTY